MKGILRRAFVLIVVFVVSNNLVAQSFWSGKNGIYGGTPYEIIAHAATGALITVTDGGIYRSTDGGANWTKITSGIASNDNFIRGLGQDNAGKLYCNSSSRFYSSTDGGLTWTQTASGSQFGYNIKVSPVNGNIFVSSLNLDQVLRSTDGGLTFASTTFSASSIRDIEVNSSGHVIVSVVGQSALYISTNNGTSWSAMSSGSYTGFPTINGSYWYKIALDASDNLYLLSDLGPYRLSSGATAWTSIKGTLTDTAFYGSIFSSGSNVYLANNFNTKFYTYNGTSWNAGVSYPAATLDITSFYQKSSTEFYLGITNLGIYKSTNSGAAWTASSNGIKAFTASDLYITPNGRLFAAYGNLGYMLSLDDGQTWDVNTAGNANRSIYGFTTLSDNSILAYGSGVIRSTDNGNSWVVQNSSQSMYSPVVVNGTNLFSFSGTNLLTSNNAGVTWTTTAISGLPFPSKIQVDASNNIYFMASNTLYKVNSGATAAAQIAGVAGVFDFFIKGNTIFALATSGTVLAKSIDGGANWSTQSLTSTFAANRIWAYDANVLITRGNALGTSHLSTDGGATWSSKSLLDTNGSMYDVEFRLIAPSDIYVYAGVNYSVLHKSTNEIVPPPAPTNLKLITTAPNYVEYIWTDNATNEDSYVVEVSEGNNSQYSIYGTGNAGRYGPEVGYTTNMAFGSIATEPNKTYFIRVYAKNGAGNSAYSNEISVTTINQCASTIPDNRSWTATTVADPGFTPFGTGPYTNSNVSLKLVTNTNNTFTLSRYVLGILDPNFHPDPSVIIQESCGEAYFYQSNDDINNTNGSWNPTTKTIVLKWRTLPYYDNFTATTTLVLNATDPVPATPALSMYPFSSTEVLLNWNQPGYEISYVIQRATVSGGPYTDIPVNYPKTSLVDKGLVTGTQYFYRIKAVNSTGSSAYSAEQAITLNTNQIFRPVENSLNSNFENQQGVSWGDLDGDGDEDIASPSFTNNSGLLVPPVFYENKGAGVFDRRDLTVLANDNDAVSRGISIADFNNDGKLDMYITRSGSNISDLLLINNGNWSFTRTTVAVTGEISTAFRSAAAADYDKDGLLDVFVGNEPANLATPSQPGLLLKNIGAGSFSKDVSSSLGTDLINARITSWVDYDNDGDQDLFTANNVSPGQSMRLYKNNGDGTFTRVTGTAFDTELNNTARTISWGDIDNDGDLDVYIGLSTANANTNFNDRLYRNDGNNTFTRLTTSEAEANATATFGSAFGDIDNDGDLDLLVANTPSGAVVNAGANGIFINNGSGTFTKSTSNELFTNPNTFEIGLALADFDQDGFLDVYPAKGQTTATDLPNFLYKNNGTLTSSKNWIEIKLEGTTSNKAAIGARVKVVTTSPARTQIREVSSRTGYGSQSSLIQHFGLGSATTISQIEVRWPSGQTQILPNVTQVNRIITIKEDFTAPAFTFNPPHNSTNVAITNKLEVTLSEPATAVAGKNLIIRKVSDTAVPLQTIAVTAGVIDANNKVTFTLAANLDYLTDYFVSIDAGAFVDIYQNASAAVAPTEWKFKTQEQPDVTPPTITFTPPTTIPKSSINSQKFEVVASDNKGLSSVTMFYRKITEQNFKSIAGVFNNSTSKYDFPLNEAYVDDMGMEYYFEAKDLVLPTPNKTLSPASGFHRARLSFGSNEKAITLSASSSKAGYRIVSNPYDETKSVGLVFETLNAPDPTKWRLLQYQHEPQKWIEGFQDVKRGLGYFALTKDAATIKFDNVVSPDYSQSNLFKLNLKKGFNLIGNPYNVPISWETVRSGLTGVGVIKTFSGSYANGDIINEFEGGFVFADNDISVDVKFKTTTGGRVGANEISSDLANENWIVPITLTQGDNTFNFGGVGMSQKSNESYDDLDDFAPPALFEKLEMQFAHPEHFMKTFARDVVNTKSYHEWEFTVAAGLTENTVMQWNNENFGDNSNELYLLDMTRHQLIDMRSTSQYEFDPSKSSRFKIYFGQNLSTKVKPEGIFLGDAFPNPATDNVTIPFTVSGSKSEYQVRLELFDGVGRKVATLIDKSLSPGFYNVVWDASASNQLVNGLLVCRLVVAGDGKTESHTNKILINK